MPRRTKPSPRPAGSPPPTASSPPTGASAGAERIVAVALAAMAVVLCWVWLDLRRGSAEPPIGPFDFRNLLLRASPGECVQVDRDRLVVIAPGPVQRPPKGPASFPGFRGDPRTSSPYLACERLVAEERLPAGSPAAVHDVYMFPLNDFGMPEGTYVALESIEPQEIRWNGRTRRGWRVVVVRYDSLEGPWKLYLSEDAPVLGTMKREFFARELPQAHRFSIPEGCR